MDSQEYIKILIEQIRCTKARDWIAEEITAHIEDQTDTYLEFGIKKEEAYQKAVEQMGDPVAAGVALDHIHRPRLEWNMLILILILSIGGIWMQFNICTASQTMEIFWRQCLFMGLGILIMMAVYFADYSFLGKYAVVCFWGYTVLILLVVNQPFTGNGVNPIQPLMYLFVPLMAGILYRYRGTSYRGLFKTLVFMLVPLLIALKFIPSMRTQTCLTLTMVFGLMVVFAIAKGWFLVNRILTILVFVGTGPALLAVGYFFTFAGYQQARLQGFLSREPDYIQQYLRNLLGGSSLGGGGMEAVSAMNGFVPDQDLYIFTNLVLAYGILAGIVLVCLLALLVIKTFHISLKQKNQLGMMVGVGTALLLLVECSGFILTNLGFGLRSSWNLPFFSADGTATLVHYILMGLLLSIYRYKDILPKEQQIAPRKALL